MISMLKAEMRRIDNYYSENQKVDVLLILFMNGIHESIIYANPDDDTSVLTLIRKLPTLCE